MLERDAQGEQQPAADEHQVEPCQRDWLKDRQHHQERERDTAASDDFAPMLLIRDIGPFDPATLKEGCDGLPADLVLADPNSFTTEPTPISVELPEVVT